MTYAVPTPEALREKHEAKWDPEVPYEPLPLRTHRAISWLQAAYEQGVDDPDVAFILRWIAFNAAYAKDFSKELAEKEFRNYFSELLRLDDRDGTIRYAIQKHFSGVVGKFLENRYVFKVYWDHQKGEVGDAVWEQEFAKDWKRIEAAMQPDTKNTRCVLTILFQRLYMLRNQLVHGGATWRSSLNRDSVRDGARIMAALVPKFIDIMLDFRKAQWGPPYYRSFPNLRLGKREE